MQPWVCQMPALANIMHGVKAVSIVNDCLNMGYFSVINVVMQHTVCLQCIAAVQLAGPDCCVFHCLSAMLHHTTSSRVYWSFNAWLAL